MPRLAFVVVIGEKDTVAQRILVTADDPVDAVGLAKRLDIGSRKQGTRLILRLARMESEIRPSHRQALLGRQSVIPAMVVTREAAVRKPGPMLLLLVMHGQQDGAGQPLPQSR